ncbi:hypothetical protein [Microcoleus sp. OTE_8_concoct_300]|uniref:hypothetical protein n=1 Tax=Microcoleus sp. OTE_8_concoct_300 TaxID=2964710 RepID=UPI00403F1428
MPVFTGSHLAIGYSSMEDTAKYPVLAQKLLVANWQCGSSRSSLRLSGHFNDTA